MHVHRIGSGIFDIEVWVVFDMGVANTEDDISGQTEFVVCLIFELTLTSCVAPVDVESMFIGPVAELSQF
jgi:hypothetical protein